MKLLNINSLQDFEEVFLSHMEEGIRKKIENSKVFLILKAKDKESVQFCESAAVMRDTKQLCVSKEAFYGLDFEVIDNSEISSYSPDYFIGKCICNVIITSELS